MNLIKRYANLISHHPYIAFLLIMLISLVAFHYSGNVGSKSMDNRDTLPDNIEVIESFEIIEDSFGGSESVMIVLEVDPEEMRKDRIIDIRDPKVISYMSLLTEMASRSDDVTGARSAADVFRQANGGTLPKKMSIIKEISEKTPALASYISDDYTMARITVNLADSYIEEEILDSLNIAIMSVPCPTGITVKPAGDPLTGPAVEATISEDMAKTSRFSMIGIIIVLLLLFGSIRYAFMPLTVIIVGLLWAFGFFGFVGLELSSATSGAMSMIMGIGIDFGIQTIIRFREELKQKKIELAMEKTLRSVFMPMFTTTLAALIGFKAMSMGDLTFLSELADMMSYGITACFIAAITVVPVIAVISERWSNNIKLFIRRFRR
jgi:uncharacterized protein